MTEQQETPESLGIVQLAEAARRLGYNDASMLYKGAQRGDFETVTKHFPGMRHSAKFIREEDLARIPKKRQRVKDDIEVVSLVDQSETEEDPVFAALAELERAARSTRKALKLHDAGVRRETIVTLAESLKEASLTFPKR
jgi:hypothetical protein